MKTSRSPFALVILASVTAVSLSPSRSHALQASATLTTIDAMDREARGESTKADELISSGILLLLVGGGSVAAGMMAGAAGAEIAVGGAIVGAVGLGASSAGLTQMTPNERRAALEKAQNDALAYMESGDQAPMQPLVAEVRAKVAAIHGSSAAEAITHDQVAHAVLQLAI